MGRLRALIVACAAALASACVAAPVRAEAHAEQRVFLIEYRPGPAWRAGQAMNRQALGPHAAYWTRLAREGRAIAAGPYLDVDGGMAIVQAASMEQAQAMLAADPAVASGVFVAAVRAWAPRIRGAGELPR